VGGGCGVGADEIGSVTETLPWWWEFQLSSQVNAEIADLRSTEPKSITAKYHIEVVNLLWRYKAQ